MTGAVLDTHAVVWYLVASTKLPPTVSAFVDSASQNGDPLYVSVISVLETVYLVEKGKLPHAALDQLVETLSDPDADLVCVPFTMAVTLAARLIPRDRVPDMPDRIIAATAVHLGVPLITRDRRIVAAGIQTIW